MNKKPNRFVGLHAHSTFSVGDGIGLPQEHIEFALQNEMDALALTDHGNMNGVSHQQVKQASLQKQGRKFKAIPGVEAYFVDNLSEWEKLLQQSKVDAAAAVTAKKKAGSKKTDELQTIGNELASTEAELDEISDAKKDKGEEEEGSGTLVEDENESKSKYSDPVKQRNHLVLLPKNSDGVKALFRLVSESYAKGFYRYPRIDLELLRKYAKGNVVALSACIAGRLAKVVFDNVSDVNVVSTENFELIQSQLKDKVEQFYDALGGPENFYAELQFNRLPAQHLVNMHLIEASKRMGVKLVATADSHYSNPTHWREREVYKAMAWASKTHGTVDTSTIPSKVEELKCELYPKNASQMWDSYKLYSQSYESVYKGVDEVVCDAVERTHDIAHQLIGELSIDKKVKLPVLSSLVDEDKLQKLQTKLGPTATEDDVAYKELVRVAVEGLKWRGKAADEAYINRLKTELEDIKYLQEHSEFKYAKYFLTYKKIMDITNKHLFTGNGRGSVSGSLLAYVLNISQVDPIRFGTLWERFLNKNKKGAADIDNDWSDRDQAVKLLIQHFGEENVIPVSNFNQLQLRSLIKDVARLFDLPFAEINAATSKIEQEALAEKKKEPGFDRATWELNYEEAESLSPTFRGLMEKYPEFEKTVKVLFKQMRNVSRHAGGVIITSNSFEGMPVIKAGGEYQTPWPEGINYRHLEEFGLLKFDILGLGTLRMFEQCIRKILLKQGKKNPSFNDVKTWFWNTLHPDNNAFDDMKVYQHVFWNGNWCGVFQFVQENVQRFMQEMKPTSIMDLAVATSIFRPGPLAAKVDRMFLRNRNNPEEVEYKHPLLKEVFAQTSGLLVFQEQLQMIYHKLAGVPLDETDGIRKAFTKKDKENKEKAAKERKALRDKFLELCKKTNNIDEEVSGELFDNMEKLVAYSFNLSHAVAYAITSYQCAWFLTYYPDEWITTYVDYCATSKGKVQGKEDPVITALKEAKRLGYEVSKPDINESEYEFTMHKSKPNTLVSSFASLSYVGKSVMYEMKMFRPYVTVYDLLINANGSWRHSKFNKRALSTLVKLEALDSMNLVGPGKMFDNYKQAHFVLVEHYDELKRVASRRKNNDVKPVLEALCNKARAEITAGWTVKERLEFQRELSGSVDFNLIVSADVQKELDRIGLSSIDDWEEEQAEGSCWAVVSSVTPATTKNGKPYLKLRLYATANKEHTCFIWNYKAGSVNVSENDVVVAKMKKGDFGFSAFPNQVYKLNR